jgi:uncharacterized protein YecE (DUF72 family)
MGDVRIGPAGWSYADWKGVVYPDPAPRGFRPLEFLAQYFDTAEVNSSYYRPPSAKQARGWIEQAAANPRFKFTAKLYKRFTHERASWPCDEEVRTYAEGIAPLADAGKLGAILIQFPWSFRRTRENRAWLAKIIDAFDAFPLAVEVRHTSWNDPAFYDGLRERGIAFCNIDQPALRDCFRPTATVTAPVAYVRLHGRNAENWFREGIPPFERYNYLYDAEELGPWTKRIRSIRELAAETYVVTNNHYRGQAIVNALEVA